ncbi:hypothetical protein GIB67_034341, partial [Kingdonia uniflora]
FLFSIYLAKWVLPKDEGPPEMSQVKAFSVISFQSPSASAPIIVTAFLLGAVCSGLAGYVRMWVFLCANVRVSSAARRSAREALHIFCPCIAVRAGGFSAIVFVGMTVLLVGYGFGASFVALFSQLGGGIFTKAADIGADLVGKVEQGIPEDDPRNVFLFLILSGRSLTFVEKSNCYKAY